MQRELTLLRVDLLLHVEVDADDDHVGDNIQCSNGQQDLWILEIYFLRDLHHAEDDHQVGAKENTCQLGVEETIAHASSRISRMVAAYIWGLRPNILAV